MITKKLYSATWIFLLINNFFLFLWLNSNNNNLNSRSHKPNTYVYHIGRLKTLSTLKIFLLMALWQCYWFLWDTFLLLSKQILILFHFILLDKASDSREWLMRNCQQGKKKKEKKKRKYFVAWMFYSKFPTRCRNIHIPTIFHRDIIAHLTTIIFVNKRWGINNASAICNFKNKNCNQHIYKVQILLPKPDPSCMNILIFNHPSSYTPHLREFH